MTWPVRLLGEIADTALGKMLDKGKLKGLPHVQYLRNVNVQWGHIDTDDLLTMELSDRDRERFGVLPGDLLVCEGGEIGRCAVWRGRDTYLAYQKALHRVRPNNQLDTSYLRYLLEHHAQSGVLSGLATGSTIAHLPQQKLRRVPVPLPALIDQRRIVEILEDHLSHLDAADAGLSDALARLDALRASLLTSARRGVVTPLSEVSVIQGGIQKQPRRAPREHAYPFLRVANVTARGLDLTDVHRVELFGDELTKLRLARGDLLVVEGNGSASQIGRAALWDGSIEDCVHQNHLIRVRVTGGLLPEYLEAVWNSPETRAELTAVASSSSGLHTLSVAKLKRVNIPVPDLADQRAIVAALADDRAARRRLVDEVHAARVKLAGLRRAVLAAAFSGKLTGRHTDDDVIEEAAADLEGAMA